MYWNDDQSGRMNFDLVSEAYEIGRPQYPPSVFASTFGRLNGRPVTLEIGSGSGQATGELAAGSKHLDCVEPGARFASHLRNSFSELNDVMIFEEDFEDFEPTRSYDLVFSACALHWIPRDIALSKIEQLLKPGGWLVAVWNQLAVTTPVFDVLEKAVGADFTDIPLPIYKPDVHEARFSEGLQHLCGHWNFHSCNMEILQRPRTVSVSTFVALLKSYTDVTGKNAEEVEERFSSIARVLTALKFESIEMLDYFPLATAQRLRTPAVSQHN